MYQEQIREIIAKMGRIGVDPRHVEGYMRIEHSTLDGLSARQFQNEVKIGSACCDADTHENAENNAVSFGL